jgi:signal transduction histidine kinase
MPEPAVRTGQPAGWVTRFAASWRADALLAAALLTWTVACLAAQARLPGRDWLMLIFAVLYGAALTVRRRWPLVPALVACVLFLSAPPLGLVAAFSGAPGAPFLWLLFFVCYSLGTGTSMGAGLAMTVLLAVAANVASQGFNPISVMLTAGPWLAGRVVLSRRTVNDQLRARNQELEAERELFALESVRYERARISRDLHDIVAHCLSVIVVQASAGQRLPEADPAGITRALESVTAAAAQAQTEVGRLVGLLGGNPPSGPAPRLDMIDELARQANLTGQAVSCRFRGPCGQLTQAASEAAYRLIQEALTNAVKHAPGAPVDITIDGHEATVQVSVVNAAPSQQPSGLEQSGSSYGLAAMRDRVTASGGTLTCGPTPSGGWHVSASLPVTASMYE